MSDSMRSDLKLTRAQSRSDAEARLAMRLVHSLARHAEAQGAHIYRVSDSGGRLETESFFGAGGVDGRACGPPWRERPGVRSTTGGNTAVAPPGTVRGG